MLNLHNGNPLLDRELRLADPDLETADVLRRFFDVIVRGQLPVDNTSDLYAAVEVWQLACRYECALVKTLAAAVMHTSVCNDKICKLVCFIAGASIGSPKLCADSLRTPQNWTWAAAKDDHSGVPGRPALEPAAMSFRSWQKIPADYMWALTRVWSATLDGEQMARAFEKLMDSIPCELIVITACTIQLS